MLAYLRLLSVHLLPKHTVVALRVLDVADELLLLLLFAAGIPHCLPCVVVHPQWVTSVDQLSSVVHGSLPDRCLLRVALAMEDGATG